MKVTKLNPGHEYKFRVKAVNRQGQSEPLTTLHSIVAKNPYGNNFLVNYSNWLLDSFFNCAVFR